MKRIVVATVTGMVVAVAVAAAAIAGGGGVSNGGFESGSLAPWTAISSGAGEWGIDSGGSRAASCARFDSFPGPSSGSFDALFDMGAPASGVLYQDVVVPTGATNLTFALTWENDASGWTIAPGAEFNVSSANQWLSVDVLRPGADPTTFDPSDIITTPVRITSGTSDLVQPWHTYSVQLARYAGKTVRLRFASADTMQCLPLGVDSVKFVANAAVQDERIAYCSVAGDTWPDGTAIPPGTFLNLEEGQPATEAEYAGAVPANYVAGQGLTCDPPPAGYTQQGTAGAAQHVAGGVYPYYAPPSS
jgi:hypothetical protein